MPKPVQSRSAAPPPPKAKPVRSRQQSAPVSAKAKPVVSRQQQGPGRPPVNNPGRHRQGFSGLQRPGQFRPSGSTGAPGGFMPPPGLPGAVGPQRPGMQSGRQMFQQVGPNGITQHMGGRPGTQGGGMFQQVGPNGVTQQMGGGTGRRGMFQSVGPDGTIYQHMNGMTQVVRPGSGGGQRPPVYNPPQHFVPHAMPGHETLPPPLPMTGGQPGQLPFPRVMPPGDTLPPPGAQGGLPQLPAHALEDNKPFVAPTGTSPVSVDLSGRRGVTGSGVLPDGSQLRLGDPASLANNPGLRIDGGGSNSTLVLPQSFSDYASIEPDQSNPANQGWNVLAPRSVNGTELTPQQQLERGLWYRNFNSRPHIVPAR